MLKEQVTIEDTNAEYSERRTREINQAGFEGYIGLYKPMQMCLFIPVHDIICYSINFPLCC